MEGRDAAMDGRADGPGPATGSGTAAGYGAGGHRATTGGGGGGDGVVARLRRELEATKQQLREAQFVSVFGVNNCMVMSQRAASQAASQAEPEPEPEAEAEAEAATQDSNGGPGTPLLGGGGAEEFPLSPHDAFPASQIPAESLALLDDERVQHFLRLEARARALELAVTQAVGDATVSTGRFRADCQRLRTEVAAQVEAARHTAEQQLLAIRLLVQQQVLDARSVESKALAEAAALKDQLQVACADLQHRQAAIEASQAAQLADRVEADRRAAQLRAEVDARESELANLREQAHDADQRAAAATAAAASATQAADARVDAAATAAAQHQREREEANEEQAAATAAEIETMRTELRERLESEKGSLRDALEAQATAAVEAKMAADKVIQQLQGDCARLTAQMEGMTAEHRNSIGALEAAHAARRASSDQAQIIDANKIAIEALQGDNLRLKEALAVQKVKAKALEAELGVKDARLAAVLAQQEASEAEHTCMDGRPGSRTTDDTTSATEASPSTRTSARGSQIKTAPISPSRKRKSPAAAAASAASEDPSEAWPASDADPAGTPAGSKASSKRRRTSKPLMVCFSGFKAGSVDFSPDARAELARQVMELGGRVHYQSAFATGITHVIAPPGARTIKTLGAVVSGSWVVKPAWVADSIANGAWLPEAAYGFRMEQSPFAGKRILLSDGFLESSKVRKDGRDVNAIELGVTFGGGRQVFAGSLETPDIVLVGTQEQWDGGGEVLTWANFLDLISVTREPLATTPGWPERQAQRRVSRGEVEIPPAPFGNGHTTSHTSPSRKANGRSQP